MAEISKQALKVDNNQSFPNNNNGAITPSILRAFNENMIDSMVDEIGYNVDSASWNQQIDSLENFTASLSTAFVSTASFNAYTSSTDGRLNNIESTTASLLIETQNLELFSASVLTSLSNLNTATASLNTSASLALVTASFDTGTRNLTFTKGDTQTFSVNIPDVSGSAGDFVTTSSFNAYTQSNDQRVSSLESNSASVNISVAALNTFSASAQISINNLNAATSSYITSAQTSSMSVLSASFAISSSHAELADLATEATNAIYAQNTIVTGKNLEATQIIKGTPLYFTGSGTAGNVVGVYRADAGNPSRMPAGGVAGEAIDTGNEGIILLDGFINGVDTSTFASGDEVFVGVGGGYTNVAPTGSALIQHLGNVEKSAVNGSGVIQMMGEARALPNIQQGYAWVGDSNGVPQPIATSSFSGGTLPAGVLSSSVTNFVDYSASVDTRINNIVVGSGFATTGSNTFVGNQNVTGDITATGYVSASYIQGPNGVFDILEAHNGVVSSSAQITAFGFISSSTTIDTGSFATTGSNVFTGDQTFSDIAGNASTLVSTSGSLMLVAKGFTSASAHLSSSAASKVNIIWKDNNNTIDTIISGSGNIFPNPSTATAGFKRYIGGNNNIYTATTIPQISGSMQFSPVMNSNIGSFGVPMRGPVSSSTWTIGNNFVGAGVVNLGTVAAPMTSAVAGCTFNSNLLMGGTVNQTANKTLLDTAPTFTSNIVFGATLNLNHNSSSINYFSNIQNGGITINNNYTPTVGSLNIRRQVYASINTVYGVNHLMTIGGTNTNTSAVRNATANLFAGTYVTASLEETGDNSSMVATNMLGNALIVSGTSASPTTGTPAAEASYGSMFSGRFNAVDGNKAKTAETIFAVGTGTGYANRKTGFLIDSGSNTFVEGTFNVSGSTSLNGDLVITGSLTSSLQQGYVWVGDASGKTTTVATSSFGGGGAAFPYTGNAVITGSLGISGSMFGGVIDLIVATATASVDFSAANMFTLTLPSASTHINPTNIRAGQTVNIQITQPTPGTGSVTFPSNVKFAGGNDYQATATGSAIDMLTLVSYDGTNVLATSIKNFL